MIKGFWGNILHPLAPTPPKGSSLTTQVVKCEDCCASGGNKVKRTPAWMTTSLAIAAPLCVLSSTVCLVTWDQYQNLNEYYLLLWMPSRERRRRGEWVITARNWISRGHCTHRMQDNSPFVDKGDCVINRIKWNDRKNWTEDLSRE